MMGRVLLVVVAAVTLAQGVPLPNDVVPQNGNSGATIQLKLMTRPIKKITPAQVKAYEKDPNNKPKMDTFAAPIGQLEEVPKTAGASYLKVNKQIVGGSAAVVKQFPWQVYLIAGNAWLCGGSIISQFWVMTAAHCVYGQTSFVINAGGIDRITQEGTYEGTRTSNNAVYHYGYNPNTLNNDVAVMKMNFMWGTSDYINVIRLPFISQATATFEGRTAIASGYGKTSGTSAASNYLNYISLTVISNTQCAAIYGSTTIISSNICTAAVPGKSICNGDSGGPLAVKESDGLYTLIGVSSFVGATACNAHPNGFARVASHLGWIRNVTRIVIV